MIDLRVLRDRWSLEGARRVFEDLAGQCVRSIHPGARSVRPDPGDGGIDTFVGQFSGTTHVWQAKYFIDGIGPSQQANIRKSFQACIENEELKGLASWTLCLPMDLSFKEHRWWQKWSESMAEKHGINMELWDGMRFTGFGTQPDLMPIFSMALGRDPAIIDAEAVSSAIRNFSTLQTKPLRNLPSDDHYQNAIFVRKLELARVMSHRNIRTAFYNFELLRHALEQGGDIKENEEFADLGIRVHELWEDNYIACNVGGYGRQLLDTVHKTLQAEDGGRLRTWLPAAAMHKKGYLHHWADLCEAGWTEDHRNVGEVADREDVGGDVTAAEPTSQ